jgi:O-phospho-L-seryl-tRNASec:L-selenocysteinyl-tRNA synthase
MGHGIGRSGDVASIQPKAVGSSMIYQLTNYLVKDAINIMGYQFANELIVLPIATGMSLALCLLTIK